MIRVGTAGWSIPKEERAGFPSTGSVLEKYTARFPCVEINSSFYRSHRPSTYARWAASAPDDFRFSVKLPKEITHKRKLADCDDLLDDFLAETSELGNRLGVYIVQIAPSLAFDETAASAFFAKLRERFTGNVACEPRHASWRTPEAYVILQRYRITRIGADPALFENGEISEPHGGFAYYRWHGSPRTYYSSYDAARLSEFAATACAAASATNEVWCIFDNTAFDAAIPNALELQSLLDKR